MPARDTETRSAPTIAAISARSRSACTRSELKSTGSQRERRRLADRRRVVGELAVQRDEVGVPVVLAVGRPFRGVRDRDVDPLVRGNLRRGSSAIRASASSHSGELSIPDSHGCQISTSARAGASPLAIEVVVPRGELRLQLLEQPERTVSVAASPVDLEHRRGVDRRLDDPRGLRSLRRVRAALGLPEVRARGSTALARRTRCGEAARCATDRRTASGARPRRAPGSTPPDPWRCKRRPSSTDVDTAAATGSCSSRASSRRARRAHAPRGSCRTSAESRRGPARSLLSAPVRRYCHPSVTNPGRRVKQFVTVEWQIDPETRSSPGTLSKTRWQSIPNSRSRSTSS